MASAAGAVRQRVGPASVAMHLDGLAGGDDVDIVEAAQLALQHFVGAQLVVELDQGDVGDDAGQVDGRLHARVAAADHRHALRSEEHTSELQSLMRISYAVFCLTKTQTPIFTSS